MDRRTFMKAGLVAGGATALAAPAIAQSAPEVKWRLTSGFPNSLDTIYGGATTLAKIVGEMTDNKFQIQVFAAGEIVPQPAIVDAIQANTVQAAHTCAYYYFGKDPTFAFGSIIPFGLNSRAQNAWLNYGDGNTLLNAFFKKFNIYGLPGGNTGAQMGGWWRKEINTVEDLKGVKMRIGGFGGAVAAKLGLVPQNIAGGDIYPALEKGTIDAAEWVGPYDDEKLGFDKIAKYYYYPGWWEGGTTVHFFFNTDEWAKLPKTYQAILTAAAGYVNVDMQAKYDKLNPGALRSLVSKGVQLKQFSGPVMDACFTAAKQTFAEMSAANADFKKIYDQQVAFRNDAYLWAQVADGSFDAYMESLQRAGKLAPGA